MTLEVYRVAFQLPPDQKIANTNILFLLEEIEKRTDHYLENFKIAENADKATFQAASTEIKEEVRKKLRDQNVQQKMLAEQKGKKPRRDWREKIKKPVGKKQMKKEWAPAMEKVVEKTPDLTEDEKDMMKYLPGIDFDTKNN